MLQGRNLFWRKFHRITTRISILNTRYHVGGQWNWVAAAILFADHVKFWFGLDVTGETVAAKAIYYVDEATLARTPAPALKLVLERRAREPDVGAVHPHEPQHVLAAEDRVHGPAVERAL